MLFKSRKSRKSASSRRRSMREAQDAATAMSRGVVAISMCAGATMWGYAMINLAT
jgi:hypothetical protein